MRTDYEGRVLHSALLYPEDVLYKVVYSLTEDDFSSYQWKRLFWGIKEALARGKQPGFELMDFLKENDLAVDLCLNFWQGSYNADTIEDPIKTIKNRSMLGRLKSIYDAATQEVKRSDTDAEKHIGKLLSDVSLVSGGIAEKPLSVIIDELKEKSKQFIGKEMFGVPYGIPAFDKLTRGMQPGHLWLLGGYTSRGKSWFALRALREFLRANRRAVYLSLEMGSEELLWRFAIQDLNSQNINLLNAKTQLDISAEDLEAVNGEFELIKSYPLQIVDNLSTLEEIELKILHAVHAQHAECVVVDYIQNILVPKSNSEYEALNRIVLRLQTIARKYRVFVIALSQINRESAKNGVSSVFGFKGSGNLENAADIAITIDEVEDAPHQRMVVVGKNREGLIGNVLCNVDFSRGSIEQCQYQPA